MVSIQSVLAVVVCSLAIVSCTTPFKDCGSKEATIDSVTLLGCDEEPCSLKRATNASFSLTFTPSQAVSTLTTKITAYLGSLPVPFNPNNTRSCDFITGCPLSKGKQTTYTQKLPVKPFYPLIPSLKVQWELVDDITGNSVTCILVEAKVVE